MEIWGAVDGLVAAGVVAHSPKGGNGFARRKSEKNVIDEKIFVIKM